MGTVTGTFRADEGDAKLLVPTKKLARVEGLSGEQRNVRKDDLESLIEYMRVNGRLPPVSDDAREYAPFVNVDQMGKPWMNEGNHRVMAADRLGWEYLPTEVRYFNGAEDEAGSFDPEILLHLHNKLYGTPRFAEGGEVRRPDIPKELFGKPIPTGEGTWDRLPTGVAAKYTDTYTPSEVARAKMLMADEGMQAMFDQAYRGRVPPNPDMGEMERALYGLLENRERAAKRGKQMAVGGLAQIAKR
jgi:hypothetical protein